MREKKLILFSLWIHSRKTFLKKEGKIRWKQAFV